MKRLLHTLWTNEEGATIIEYVLLAALISIVSIAAIGRIGSKVNAQYETVRDQVPGG